MPKMAKGAGSKRGIGLSSLAATGILGFLAGYMLSGTNAGDRITNACFNDIPGLSASDSTTKASCFAVLKESFANWPITDGITGLAEKPLFGAPDKLKLADTVLKAHTRNLHERQIHNVNLRH